MTENEVKELLGKPVIISWGEAESAAGIFEEISKDGYAVLDWGYGVNMAAENFTMELDDAAK